MDKLKELESRIQSLERLASEQGWLIYDGKWITKADLQKYQFDDAICPDCKRTNKTCICDFCFECGEKLCTGTCLR